MSELQPCSEPAKDKLLEGQDGVVIIPPWRLNEALTDIRRFAEQASGRPAGEELALLLASEFQEGAAALVSVTHFPDIAARHREAVTSTYARFLGTLAMTQFLKTNEVASASFAQGEESDTLPELSIDRHTRDYLLHASAEWTREVIQAIRSRSAADPSGLKANRCMYARKNRHKLRLLFGRVFKRGTRKNFLLKITSPFVRSSKLSMRGCSQWS